MYEPPGLLYNFSPLCFVEVQFCVSFILHLCCLLPKARQLNSLDDLVMMLHFSINIMVSTNPHRQTKKSHFIKSNVTSTKKGVLLYQEQN